VKIPNPSTTRKGKGTTWTDNGRPNLQPTEHRTRTNSSSLICNLIFSKISSWLHSQGLLPTHTHTKRSTACPCSFCCFCFGTDWSQNIENESSQLLTTKTWLATSKNRKLRLCWRFKIKLVSMVETVPKRKRCSYRFLKKLWHQVLWAWCPKLWWNVLVSKKGLPCPRS
jgi:hypothetical protein